MINNNESMATVVETFFIEETTNLIHDSEALSTWNKKCEELELEGQKKVIIEGKSPIPFLWMNEAVVNTFEILCPTKVDIKNYEQTPIPVELLQTVSLCVKEQYFDGIKVWYNEKEKDPVIVGYKMTNGKAYSDSWDANYYSKKYLIGRWADVKASLDQLITRAKSLFTQSETIRLKKDIRDRQRELEDLEHSVESKFGGAMPSTILPF